MSQRKTKLEDTPDWVFGPSPFGGMDTFKHTREDVEGVVDTLDDNSVILQVSLERGAYASAVISGSGQTFAEAIRDASRRAQPAKRLIDLLARAVSAMPCDGNHAEPACADPCCWLNDPPAPDAAEKPVAMLTEGGET